MTAGWVAFAAFGATDAATAAPESCHAPVEVAHLDELLARAEAALTTLDQEELDAALRSAKEAASCVDGVLSAARVARLHRVAGVAAFGAGDPAAAWDAFAVARALEPSFELDPALGPPLHKLFAAAPTAEERVRLAPVAEGWGVIDGGSAQDAPTSRPYFAQWFHPDGTVRANTFVGTGQAPPFAPFLPPERERVAGRGGQLAATGAVFLGIGIGAVATGPLVPDRGIGTLSQIGGAAFSATGAFLIGLAAGR